MTNFYGEGGVWPAIRARAGKGKRIVAAIAYLTDPKCLPFKRGDSLIANLSKKALATGSSNPQAAIDLPKGVEIRSAENLHGKVVFVGNRLFVGSMNATYNSESLNEAAIETTDPGAHLEAAKWMFALAADAGPPLTRVELEDLKKFYRAPKGGNGGGHGGGNGEGKRGKRRKGKGAKSGPLRGWILVSESDAPWKHWDKASEILDEGPSDLRLKGYDVWSWERPKYGRTSMKKGDVVISVDHGKNGITVWPPAEIWRIESEGSLVLIFTANPASDRKKTLSGAEFRRIPIIKQLKDLRRDTERLLATDIASALIETWPKPTSRQ